MALNLSRRSFFADEDNLRMGNGYRVEGKKPEMSGGGGDSFGKVWPGVENPFASDRCNRGPNVGASAAQDSVSKDILDILPSDPFGMDISTTFTGMDIGTTFTAITGWLEDLEFDYGGYQRDQLRPTEHSYQLFAELNFFWNNAMRFHGFPGGNTGVEERNVLHGQSGPGESSSSRGDGAVSCNFDFGYACDDMHDMLGLGREFKDVAIASVSGDTTCMGDVSCLGGDDLAPHPALSFCLSYLGLPDLLVVEGVCKYLQSTVRGDPLLWRSIHIDQPLNERITDDVLLELTNRAQGNLQCLSLVECTRITDEGLKRVLLANPKLIKVSMHYHNSFVDFKLDLRYVAVHLKHVCVYLYLINLGFAGAVVLF